MDVLPPELNVKNYAIPTVESWPLMGSPAPLILIFTVYLWFVLNIGPKYMATQKPKNLTTFTRLYNIFQVVSCSLFLNQAQYFNFNLFGVASCLPTITDPKVYVHYKSVQWWFLLLRLAELVETVTFVLRKKQNQVSTLHVYHHITTATIVWTCIKYCDNYMDAHPAYINTSVHIIMYSYYFMTSFKSLSFITNVIKPFITKIQLIQLVIIFAHSAVAALPSCYSSKIFLFQAINAGVLIFFFAQFYVRSYLNKKKQNE